MLRKTLAGFLAVFYFATNVLLAHAAETTVWQQRRKRTGPAQPSPVQLAALPAPLTNAFSSPANLIKQMPVSQEALPTIGQHLPAIEGGRIPPTFQSFLNAVPANAATVREIHAAPDAKNAVILIQDVHMNQEAQQNIAAAITALGKKNQDVHPSAALSVAVEGATGVFDFKKFQVFADQPIKQAVADAFLRDNLISAPCYAGLLSSPGLLHMTGVDDERHYQANVAAYVEASTLKKRVAADLDRQKRDMVERKLKSLNADLKAFDARSSAFQSGDLSFGAYVVYLSKLMELHNADLDLSVEQFVAAYGIEKNLDFSVVERDRVRVVEQLAKKLSENELKKFLADSLVFRSGSISYGAYYAALRQRIEKAGIALASYPLFDRYVRYVLLADGINADKLMKAISRMEKTALVSLCKTEQEKALMAESHKLFLTQKLVDFSMTPEEWEEYKILVHSPWTIDHRPNLSPFERFYEEADIRSRSIVNNLASSLQPIAHSSVLVVGGFHTPLITKLLKERGVSYAVLQPKITKIDGANGSEYLSVFTREKTTLDRLFEGEKLSIVPNKLLAGSAGGALASVQMFLCMNALRSGADTYVSEAGSHLYATAGHVPLWGQQLFAIDISGYGKVVLFSIAAVALILAAYRYRANKLRSLIAKFDRSVAAGLAQIFIHGVVLSLFGASVTVVTVHFIYATALTTGVVLAIVFLSSVALVGFFFALNIFGTYLLHDLNRVAPPAEPDKDDDREPETAYSFAWELVKDFYSFLLAEPYIQVYAYLRRALFSVNIDLTTLIRDYLNECLAKKTPLGIVDGRRRDTDGANLPQLWLDLDEQHPEDNLFGLGIKKITGGLGGTVILKRGDRSADPFILLSGAVQIKLEEKSDAFEGKGPVFGEMAVDNLGRRTADVIVREGETVEILQVKNTSEHLPEFLDPLTQLIAFRLKSRPSPPASHFPTASTQRATNGYQPYFGWLPAWAIKIFLVPFHWYEVLRLTQALQSARQAKKFAGEHQPTATRFESDWLLFIISTITAGMIVAPLVTLYAFVMNDPSLMTGSQLAAWGLGFVVSPWIGQIAVHIVLNALSILLSLPTAAIIDLRPKENGERVDKFIKRHQESFSAWLEQQFPDPVLPYVRDQWFRKVAESLINQGIDYRRTTFVTLDNDPRIVYFVGPTTKDGRLAFYRIRHIGPGTSTDRINKAIQLIDERVRGRVYFDQEAFYQRPTSTRGLYVRHWRFDRESPDITPPLLVGDMTTVPMNHHVAQQVFEEAELQRLVLLYNMSAENCPTTFHLSNSPQEPPAPTKEPAWIKATDWSQMFNTLFAAIDEKRVNDLLSTLNVFVPLPAGSSYLHFFLLLLLESRAHAELDEMRPFIAIRLRDAIDKTEKIPESWVEDQALLRRLVNTETQTAVHDAMNHVWQHILAREIDDYYEHDPWVAAPYRLIGGVMDRQGRYIAKVDKKKGGIEVRNIVTAAVVRKLKFISPGNHWLAFSGDGKYLFATNESERIFRWNTDSWGSSATTENSTDEPTIVTPPDVSGKLSRIEANEDGSVVAVELNDKVKKRTPVLLVNFLQAEVIDDYLIGREYARYASPDTIALGFGPDNALYAIDSDGNMGIWESAGGEERASQSWEHQDINHFAFLPVQIVLGIDENGAVSIMDRDGNLIERNVLEELYRQASPTFRIEKGNLYLSVRYQPGVRRWDAQDRIIVSAHVKNGLLYISTPSEIKIVRLPPELVPVPIEPSQEAPSNGASHPSEPAPAQEALSAPADSGLPTASATRTREAGHRRLDPVFQYVGFSAAPDWFIAISFSPFYWYEILRLAQSFNERIAQLFFDEHFIDKEQATQLQRDWLEAGFRFVLALTVMAPMLVAVIFFHNHDPSLMTGWQLAKWLMLFIVSPLIGQISGHFVFNVMSVLGSLLLRVKLPALMAGFAETITGIKEGDVLATLAVQDVIIENEGLATHQKEENMAVLYQAFTQGKFEDLPAAWAPTQAADLIPTPTGASFKSDSVFAYSPGGQYLVGNGIIELNDPSQTIHPIAGLSSTNVTEVRFGPKGLVAAVRQGVNWALVDIVNRRVITLPPNPEMKEEIAGSITDVLFGPDGQHVGIRTVNSFNDTTYWRIVKLEKTNNGLQATHRNSGMMAYALRFRGSDVFIGQGGGTWISMDLASPQAEFREVPNRSNLFFDSYNGQMVQQSNTGWARLSGNFYDLPDFDQHGGFVNRVYFGPNPRYLGVEYDLQAYSRHGIYDVTGGEGSVGQYVLSDLRSARFSPDGRYVAYEQGNSGWKVRAFENFADEDPLGLGANTVVTELEFSPDGRYVAVRVLKNNKYRWLLIDITKEKPEVREFPELNQNEFHSVQFRPDGLEILARIRPIRPNPSPEATTFPAVDGAYRRLRVPEPKKVAAVVEKQPQQNVTQRNIPAGWNELFKADNLFKKVNEDWARHFLQQMGSEYQVSGDQTNFEFALRLLSEAAGRADTQEFFAAMETSFRQIEWTAEMVGRVIRNERELMDSLKKDPRVDDTIQVIQGNISLVEARSKFDTLKDLKSIKLRNFGGQAVSLEAQVVVRASTEGWEIVNLATGKTERVLPHWKEEADRARGYFLSHHEKIFPIFSGDGLWLFVRTGKSEITVWDTHSWAPEVLSLNPRIRYGNLMASNYDGSRLAITYEKNKWDFVAVLNGQDAAPLLTLDVSGENEPFFAHTVFDLAMNRKNEVAAMGRNGRMIIWSENGQISQRSSDHDLVNRILFTPDSSYLIGVQGNVKLIGRDDLDRILQSSMLYGSPWDHISVSQKWNALVISDDKNKVTHLMKLPPSRAEGLPTASTERALNALRPYFGWMPTWLLKIIAVPFHPHEVKSLTKAADSAEAARAFRDEHFIGKTPTKFQKNWLLWIISTSAGSMLVARVVVFAVFMNMDPFLMSGWSLVAWTLSFAVLFAGAPWIFQIGTHMVLNGISVAVGWPAASTDEKESPLTEPDDNERKLIRAINILADDAQATEQAALAFWGYSGPPLTEQEMAKFTRLYAENRNDFKRAYVALMKEFQQRAGNGANRAAMAAIKAMQQLEESYREGKFEVAVEASWKYTEPILVPKEMKAESTAVYERSATDAKVNSDFQLSEVFADGAVFAFVGDGAGNNRHGEQASRLAAQIFHEVFRAFWEQHHDEMRQMSDDELEDLVLKEGFRKAIRRVYDAFGEKLFGTEAATAAVVSFSFPAKSGKILTTLATFADVQAYVVEPGRPIRPVNVPNYPSLRLNYESEFLLRLEDVDHEWTKGAQSSKLIVLRDYEGKRSELNAQQRKWFSTRHIASGSLYEGTRNPAPLVLTRFSHSKGSALLIGTDGLRSLSKKQFDTQVVGREGDRLSDAPARVLDAIGRLPIDSDTRVDGRDDRAISLLTFGDGQTIQSSAPSEEVLRDIEKALANEYFTPGERLANRRASEKRGAPIGQVVSDGNTYDDQLILLEERNDGDDRRFAAFNETAFKKNLGKTVGRIPKSDAQKAAHRRTDALEKKQSDLFDEMNGLLADAVQEGIPLSQVDKKTPVEVSYAISRKITGNVIKKASSPREQREALVAAYAPKVAPLGLKDGLNQYARRMLLAQLEYSDDSDRLTVADTLPAFALLDGTGKDVIDLNGEWRPADDTHTETRISINFTNASNEKQIEHEIKRAREQYKAGTVRVIIGLPAMMPRGEFMAYKATYDNDTTVLVRNDNRLDLSPEAVQAMFELASLTQTEIRVGVSRKVTLTPATLADLKNLKAASIFKLFLLLDISLPPLTSPAVELTLNDLEHWNTFRREILSQA